jgi:hypothetical protein
MMKDDDEEEIPTLLKFLKKSKFYSPANVIDAFSGQSKSFL